MEHGVFDEEYWRQVAKGEPEPSNDLEPDQIAPPFRLLRLPYVVVMDAIEAIRYLRRS
jgi:lipoate synthase